MASRIAQIRKSVLTLALPVTVSSLLQRTEGIVAGLSCRWSRRHIHRSRRTWPVAGIHGHHPRLRIIGGCKRPRAQLWGARRTKDVGEAATHLLGLAAIVSCTLMAFGWSLNRVIMELLGAENDVITLALPYSNLIFWSFPARSSCRSSLRLCKAPETLKLRCTP
jgi:Na+-driven multidrug efflux pump